MMKKIIFLFFISFFSATLCLAQKNKGIVPETQPVLPMPVGVGPNIKENVFRTDIQPTLIEESQNPEENIGSRLPDSAQVKSQNLGIFRSWMFWLFLLILLGLGYVFWKQNNDA